MRLPSSRSSTPASRKTRPGLRGDRILGRNWRALLCTGISLLAAACGQKAPTPTTPPPTTPNPTAAFLVLEAREKQLDETLWQPEIEAQRHGQVIVALWDDLRQHDGYEVAGRFDFERLVLPTTPRRETFEHSISRNTFTEPLETLDRSGWLEMLRRLKSRGFRLAQSEWRHVEFRPAGVEPARSRFQVELHLGNESQQIRSVVRFELRIAWAKQEPAAPPRAEVLEVRAPVVLERPGIPVFRDALAELIEPVPHFETLDPGILLHDLNGDHLPEVAVVTKNLVLRNEAGRLTPEPIVQNPPQPMHHGMFADFTGDGRTDFLAADTRAVWLWEGDVQGQFAGARRLAWRAPGPVYCFAWTAGDIDLDGDLDVWLTQYKLPYVEGQMPTPYYDANDGFPSYLLLNDGRGNFRDATEASGLAAKRFRRTYSAAFLDFDRDGDLDLANVSDFAGIELYRNEGTGRFENATLVLLPEWHGFGMALTTGDYDGDGALDMLMVGMNSDAASRLEALGLTRDDLPDRAHYRRAMTYGNRLFSWSGQRFTESRMAGSIARAGWAWGATSFDFDEDGDTDVFIVNGHNSRASVADYEPQFWTHDIYIGTSEHRPATQLFFQSAGTRLYGDGRSYGGFQKDRFFLNLGHTNFLEAGYLLGAASEADSRSAASADLDGDGQLDLIYTTLRQWPTVQLELRALKNGAPRGSWIAFALRDGPRVHAPGTIIELTLNSGAKLVRTCLLGDSYRTQHAAILHFGLGTETAIREARIFAIGAKTPRVLPNPATGQVHAVALE